MLKYIFILFTTFLYFSTMSQNKNIHETFFKDISNPSDTIDSKAVLIRMIDGLGFRFYWATEGLRPEDYDYKISEESRTSGETISHVRDLSIMILAACKGISKNDLQIAASESNPEIYKNDILKLLYEAREYLSSNIQDIQDVKIVLSRPEGEIIFPIWNLIHGPISDVLWHTGQIASFRRASGNSINERVSFFSGKER